MSENGQGPSVDTRVAFRSAMNKLAEAVEQNILQEALIQQLTQTQVVMQKQINDLQKQLEARAVQQEETSGDSAGG